MTAPNSPLQTAENAILDAAEALAEVHPDPSNPIARTALRRACEALLTASNSLHLAQLATETGRVKLPPGQEVAAL